MSRREFKWLDENMKWLKERMNVKVVTGAAITLAIVSMVAFGTVADNNLQNEIAVNTAEETISGEADLAERLSSDGGTQVEADQLEGLKEDFIQGFGLTYDGYALYADDEEMGFFRTKEEAEEVVNQLMATGVPVQDLSPAENQGRMRNDSGDDADGEDDDLEVSVKEEITIVQEKQKIGLSDGYDEVAEALHYIEKGTDEEVIHKVQSGENFWTIAEAYDVSVDDLIAANPAITPERLQIGEEISLVVAEPLITVTAVEQVAYGEAIPYDTVYEENGDMYRGSSKTKTVGQEGEKIITAEVYYENGIEVGRTVLGEEVASQPSDKVVYRGTMNPPPAEVTGTLSSPVSRGTVTSEYGARWSRQHEGLDISMPIGTDVLAADGGEVIYAGNKSGYGLFLLIDHGDGVQTAYAHNSVLNVKKGDQVYKGQVIAQSGNTGNTTGPHLHFEVRINGIPVDPRTYVNF